ncbi:MAG: putative rane-bound metalloprotease [Brevibacillus sp.]|jgi:membrane protease YdiL (CAAX protease family)|nr:putative rane-bound metalloprotease [Brevibacillus sp.]
MTLFFLLLGPTMMLFFGLQIGSNVPLAFLLFYGWLALVPVFDFLLLKKMSLQDALHQVGFVCDRKNALVGSATGICFFLFIVTGGYLFHSVLFDRASLSQLLVKWQFTGDVTGWLIAILVFLNPLLEELYWRGYLLHKLTGRHKARTAIFLAAFFYSLYHLLSVIPLFSAPYNVMMVVPVFAAGLFWGYLRNRQRSLFGSIISHMLADAGIMTVYLLFLS